MRNWSMRRTNAPHEDRSNTEVAATATAVAVAVAVAVDESSSAHTSATAMNVAALLGELPMQHASVSRALIVLDDPNADARQVAAVLESDPALCARALQLANSAPYGMSGRVTSVDQAVVSLGATALRTLVVSTAAGMFGGPDDLPAGFWDHSVAVAAATAIAARLSGVPRGDAICAGLLHDLGVALLFRFDRAGSEARLAAGTERADRLLDEETHTYGADHAMVGAEALAAWGLPPAMVDALRAHHRDPADVGDKLGRIVIAGEALARAAFDAPPFVHEPARDPGAVFAALGIRVASVDTLVTRTAEETEVLAEMLGTR